MVYDSAFDDLPLDEQIVISMLVGTDSNVLKVKFADIQMQRNSYDCGLYAITNVPLMTERRNGTSHMTPGTSVTWQHNVTILEYTEQQSL